MRRTTADCRCSTQSTATRRCRKRPWTTSTGTRVPGPCGWETPRPASSNWRSTAGQHARPIGYELWEALGRLLAIPHFIVLIFLGIATIVVVVVAWFAILFTRRYPRGIFDFVHGVIRWHNWVTAYAFVLVTDRYPPFSLSS